MSRVRVKICGITTLSDALLAAELGADMLGFIFYAKSPRAIEPAAARAIIDRLPPYVTPVAVVVNESVEAVRRILDESGCLVAQLHGDESSAFLEALGRPAMRAVAVAEMADLDAIPHYPLARAILLDTKVPGQSGGTGRTFDWHIAREARRYGRPIVLAGGLCPENIADAIRIAQPDAVDISSGIEAAPGRKEHEKMRQLFAAIASGRTDPLIET